MMIMFSWGVSGTTTVLEDVAQQAVTLEIPIYPVLTHAKNMPERWQTRGAYEFFEEHLGRPLKKMTALSLQAN